MPWPERAGQNSVRARGAAFLAGAGLGRRAQAAGVDAASSESTGCDSTGCESTGCEAAGVEPGRVQPAGGPRSAAPAVGAGVAAVPVLGTVGGLATAWAATGDGAASIVPVPAPSALGEAGGNSPLSRPENIVHHTMPTSSAIASRASSKITPMHASPSWLKPLGPLWPSVAIVALLGACANGPRSSAPVEDRSAAPAGAPASSTPNPGRGAVAGAPQDTTALPSPILQPRSRWVPVRWAELPGWPQDDWGDFWSAWVASCERPSTNPSELTARCESVRSLQGVSQATQQAWVQAQFVAYRVEPLTAGAANAGALTGYFEPVLSASRQSDGVHTVPIHALPAGLAPRQGWYSRQEIAQNPAARAALSQRVIAYVRDPVDAQVLQIQGSGRLTLREADGSQRVLRLGFAGSNEQPYQSVGRWLLDQGLTRDASWAGVKAWLAQNPNRAQELLLLNPRYVFFKEEASPDAGSPQPLSRQAAQPQSAALLAAAVALGVAPPPSVPVASEWGGPGPRGAQGVALRPGRSIAVDRQSIPLGTPVWLVSGGPALNLARGVVAQDTGSAITGAVRADYFVGAGAAAGELAGRIKQPLALWVIWPR